MRGYPPIVERVVRNDAAATAALLDAGVDPDATFAGGVYQVGTGGVEPAGEDWPLTVFAGRHRAAATLDLLLERGAAVPEAHRDAVLLGVAGARPHDAAARAVSRLLAAGADPATCTPDGYNALNIAALNGNLATLDVLIAAGASVDGRDTKGRTALHALLRLYGEAKAPLLQRLLGAGAPVDVQDLQGDTPLRLAIRSASFEAVLAILRRATRGAGRLTPERLPVLEAAVERARRVETKRGPPSDLFGLLAAGAWDEIVDLAEAGMSLEVMNALSKTLWMELLKATPIEVQRRALPLIDDRDLLLRVVAQWAAKDGRALLESALSLGADLNLPGEGNTVLGAALVAGAPFDVLELLVSHGASVQGAPGRSTPAHAAARFPDRLAWLRAQGADLDRTVARVGTPLQLAIDRGYDDGARFLVEAGARLDVLDSQGRTPLAAAAERQAQGLLAAMAARGATVDVDPRPVALRTTARGALQRACADGAVDEVARLVGAGADPSGRDPRGTTPLAAAAAHDRLDVVRVLIAHGADLEGATPTGIRPWALAVHTGSAAVERFLVAAGASTVPVLLIETGDVLERFGRMIDGARLPDLARAIDAGLDVDLPLIGSRERGGSTPLVRAVSARHDSVVELLLRAGADPSSATRHISALMLAAHIGHEPIVGRLIDAGADVGAVSIGGWNAAGMATRAGHAAVVELLARAGSVPQMGWEAEPW